MRWVHLVTLKRGRISASATRTRSRPAIGAYTWQQEEGAHLPFALDVLTLEASGDGARIKGITSFITRSTTGDDPDFYLHWPRQPVEVEKVGAFFERFGLPPRLD